MLRHRENRVWTTGLVALIVASVAGCGGDAQADSTADAEMGGESFVRVINVQVDQLEVSTFAEEVSLTGTVEADQDVMLAAEEAGAIVEVYREKGAAVRKGQAIARINDRILAAQVAQARAQAALANETWERRKRLFEQDQVGSELAYLEAKYSAEQSQASLAALEGRLANTVIRAPITGILDDRMIEVGSMVAPGTVVARVIDLDPVKVSAGVPERYALDVEQGAAVTVSFDVLPGEVIEGSISYVGAAVNPRNRTFPVEFTLPNEGARIKPEMVANVSIVRGIVEDALVVPQGALVRVEDGYVAFVVEEDDGQLVARSRVVERGPAQRNQAVVTSGLSPGDQLIVVGQQQVEDGDRVRIVSGEAQG